MYTKEISYVDYDGNERTETFFFNLNEAELLEMDMLESGGLDKMLRRIVSEQNSKRIFEMFKKIIMKAYGVKTLDGRRLEKSDQLSKEFTETEAYNKLVMELFTDPDKAADFIRKIIPANLSAEAAKQLPMA